MRTRVSVLIRGVRIGIALVAVAGVVGVALKHTVLRIVLWRSISVLVIHLTICSRITGPLVLVLGVVLHCGGNDGTDNCNGKQAGGT